MIAIEQPFGLSGVQFTGSVTKDFCEVCHSELGEFRAPAAPISALESVHMQPGSDGKPVLPSIDPVPIHRRRRRASGHRRAGVQGVGAGGVSLGRRVSPCRVAPQILRLQFIEDIGIGERQERVIP